MKNKFAVILSVVALLAMCQRGFSADAQSELSALVMKVRADIQSGKTNEAALSDDLKQFDAVLAEHKGEKTDAVAQILYMKAALYSEVLHNDAKAKELLAQLKTEFKDTSFVALLEKQMEAQKIRDSLVVGTNFPDFKVEDVGGHPLSIARDNGKVILVDFWATWCPPCRMEMPNVIATYQKYHGQGFDIIGVSLDQDKQQLLDYTKDQNMPWPQFFDGQKWDNKLAVKYGVESIPSNYLLDSTGKIIGKDLRGEELEAAVAQALSKK